MSAVSSPEPSGLGIQALCIHGTRAMPRGLILCLAGVVSEAIYLLGLALPFPLVRLYNVPLVDLGKLTHYEPQAFALFLLLSAILVGAYWLATRACSGTGTTPDSTLVVLGLGFPMLFHLTLIFAYPVGAADLFGYVTHGRLLAMYGLNPLVTPATQIPGDPAVALAAWPDQPSAYGPLWALLNGGVTRLLPDILPNLIGLKLVAAAAWVTTTVMVYWLLRRREPERALAGAVFVGWNPLAIYEVAANGHNDALLGPLLVLALGLARGSRPAVALLPLAIGALLKFVPLVLVPLLAAEIWRRRAWRALLPAVALSVVIVVAAYAPFWEGEATFAGLRLQAGQFTTSPAMLLRLSLEERLGSEPAGQVARTVTLSLFAGAAAAIGVALLRRGWPLPLAASLLLAAYLALLTWWFQPWYLLWLLPVAALTPVAWLRRFTFLWTCTAGLTYAVFVYVWVINADRLSYSDVQWMAVAVLYVPLVLYALFVLWQMRRRNRPAAYNGH